MSALRAKASFLLPVLPFVLLAAAGACSSGDGSGSGDPKPGDEKPLDPGTEVSTQLSENDQQELDRLQKELAAVGELDAEGLQSRYPVSFASELGYDPLTATGLDTINGSAFGLNDAEQAKLAENGFVISTRNQFPSFTYGYASLYLEDLPVYISADSVIHAVHRSFDDMLADTERQALKPALEQMLRGMRAELAAGGASSLDAAALKDVDFFLTVALSLLMDDVQAANDPANDAAVAAFIDKVMAADGMEGMTLFGVPRDMDFSQFEPRGHYRDDVQLEPYFRAMMWLGRIDFRLIETQPDGSQVFHRRQLEASVAMNELLTDSARQMWERLERVIGGLVGEPDNMIVSELDALLGDLGVRGVGELAGVDDATIAQAILDGGYGTQRISSHLMTNIGVTKTLPLSSTFLLFGQRYVLDSHVFSNVVWDRTEQQRMMPDPLDAAFGALGNNQAAQLLDGQLKQYEYASNLASVRVLADEHPDEFWNANVYNHWLGSLRALSPSGDLSQSNLPSVAQSETWGRRILNTQLASWAELRHDTLLYAKQSYTSLAACEYPDGYVDPYPQFFAGVRKLAEKGAEVLEDVGPSGGIYYFGRLAETATALEGIAQHQLSGEPLTAAQLEFINDAVTLTENCDGTLLASGWYPKMFYSGGVEKDPTIADVHTQPTDEVGNPVGKVLHVGTGLPRLMVVTVDTCSGPRAYAGLASSYHEQITTDFERMNDEQWATNIEAEPPEDVPWLGPVLAD